MLATIEDLELAIFEILAEGEIITLGDQKETARAIAQLILPPFVTNLALTAIVKQLRFCGYTCEGGPLEKNVAFLALVELSQLRILSHR